MAKELLCTAPSNWRRERARKIMQFGENEPPTLPSISVCRTIRQEAKKKEYGLPNNKNVLFCLQQMKYSDYAGVIHTIGLDPFFVHYWTKYQNYVFKAYAKTPHSTVHIDATGSLVKKIKDENRVSRHIFLYEIVIHVDNKSISVSQMLSEAQDTSTIAYWLNKWIKDVGKIPKESVTDFSLALIGACCRAFNDCSIKGYLKTSFSLLLGKDAEKLPCFIRIDVAHLINLVSRWKCFDKRTSLVRKFYIRCVALMVKSTSLLLLKNIILNTLILCKSDTCGINCRTEDLSAAEKAKLFLGQCIETGEPDAIINKDESEIKKDSYLEENIENLTETNSWVEDIINEATLAALNSGNEPNPYFCPEFGNKLVKIINYCPLWTGIMKDIFLSPNKTASSAIVECDFSILKQIILEHHKRPIRVDNFIACHVRALSGNLNILAASMKDQVHVSQKDEIRINELCEEESWKGKNMKNDTTQKEEKQEMIHQHKKFTFTKTLEKSEKSSEKRIHESQKLTKKEKSYLNPYPNIEFVLHSPNRRGEKLPIIKNGNLLEPIKFNEYIYSVSNTCPFDALMHSIAVICVDNKNYANFAMNSKSDFFKCIQVYLQKGVTKQLYELRTQLLLRLYPVQKSSSVKNLMFINAEDSVGNIINNLFKDHPSAIEVSQCKNATCINNRKRGLVFWPIDINSLQIGSGNFLEAVKYHMRIVNKPCKAPCKLRRTVEIIPQETVFIEPVFKDVNDYRVKDLPICIQLRDDKYILGAVIMYVESRHFITYCRRKDNMWEVYDDMKTSTVNIDENRILGAIQIIIYTKLCK